MVATKRNRLDGHTRRMIAVYSLSDPRTVEKLLRGGSVRPSARERIVGALRDLGFEHLIPRNGEGRAA